MPTRLLARPAGLLGLSDSEPECPFAPVVSCSPEGIGLCTAGLVVFLLIKGTDAGDITLDWPNATLTDFAAAEAVVPIEQACLPGFYRSKLDSVCRARHVEAVTVPCTLQTDRVCVPPLLVELSVNGSVVVNASSLASNTRLVDQA